MKVHRVSRGLIRSTAHSVSIVTKYRLFSAPGSSAIRRRNSDSALGVSPDSRYEFKIEQEIADYKRKGGWVG